MEEESSETAKDQGDGTTNQVSELFVSDQYTFYELKELISLKPNIMKKRIITGKCYADLPND